MTNLESKLLAICRDENIDVLIDSYWEATLSKQIKWLFCIHVIHGHFKLLYNPNLANYNVLVLLTRQEYSIWAKNFKHIEVIPNFVKAPKESCDITSQNIIFVGRLTEQKGLFRLLKAFSKMKVKRHLMIVGDDEQKEALKDYIIKHNLDASIEGYKEDVGSYYKKASIFAMTSFHEGLPMVMLEALSYGLPLVAFDVPTGPSECIEDNKNGFLIKDDDIESFAKALDTLSSDEALRRTFGARSQEIFLSKFEESKVTSKWLKLLDF
ncbi:glycosyltransferase [Helicobacter sp. 11S02629-2]|uniref:glycosyltransferase n=1 Tax=Helicobacter sp. 11S02629-2 TaxID=1476195 RepID=UPI000BA56F2B|nr:glycosyltransferase [Helicobacter sp. 11S02629-2]PAF45581.1 hypothetical protein BKH40_01490 [Helicobacter sp. 11S02629-2]